MKWTIYLFFILLVPLNTLAAEVVFDDWATHGFLYETTENQEMTVRVIGDRVSIDIGLNSLIVTNDSCEAKDFANICVTDLQFSHYNYTIPGRKAYKAKIVIEQDTTAMELEFTVNRETVSFNEVVVFTSKIENTGELALDEVVLTNKVLNAEIVNSGDCFVDKGNVTWSGSLAFKGIKKCVFSVKATGHGHVEVKTVVDYKEGIGLKQLVGSESIPVVEFPIAIDAEFGAESIEINDLTHFHIELVANRDLTLDDLSIIMPPGLRIEEVTGGEKINDTLVRFTDRFIKDEDAEINISIRGMARGVHTVGYVASLTEGLEAERYSKIQNLTVTGQAPFVRVEKTVAENGNIQLLVVNPEKIEISRAVLEIFGTVAFETPVIEIGNIAGSQHKEISVMTKSSSGNYSINATLTYFTPYGETGTRSLNESFEVVQGFVPVVEKPPEVEQPGAVVEVEEPNIVDKVTSILPEAITSRTSSLPIIIAFAVAVIIILFVVTKLLGHTSGSEE